MTRMPMERRDTAFALIVGTVLSLGVPVARAEEPLPVRPTEGYLPRFSRTVAPARRGRARIVTDFPTGLRARTWPVTFGVPFPRGAVRSVKNMRIVTTDGAEVPAQFEKTATWHSPDGDVKWVLVDMAAQRGKDYFVEYGSQVARAEAASPLKVVDAQGHIAVDTGPLRVTFDRTKSCLMEGVWLDRNDDGRFEEKEQMLAARKRMFIVDHAGKRYETSDKPEDYRLELEVAGPRRVVVKATGLYRDGAGTALCEYVTRVHLYAGQPMTRVLHTFVAVFDTDKTQIRDLALPFDLAGGRASQATFAVETGFSAATKTVSVPAYLVQDTAEHFTLTNAAGAIAHEGRRVAGWVDVGSPGAGLSVGLRNMWQEFPRELEATPQGIVAHLWPRHGDRLLDFRAEGQLGPERYKDYSSRPSFRDFYKGGLDACDQAFGIAKTNDLMVVFHAAEPEAARDVRHARGTTIPRRRPWLDVPLGRVRAAPPTQSGGLQGGRGKAQHCLRPVRVPPPPARQLWVLRLRRRQLHCRIR